MECIACNIPLVITGALPGQEEGNPKFAEKYNLGIECANIKNLRNTIDDLLSSNGKNINEIRNAQKNYINPSITKDIMDFILDTKNF
jgi:processive 1,2-diacylglycerol beta-glucosyltransferase